MSRQTYVDFAKLPVIFETSFIANCTLYPLLIKTFTEKSANKCFTAESKLFMHILHLRESPAAILFLQTFRYQNLAEHRKFPHAPSRKVKPPPRLRPVELNCTPGTRPPEQQKEKKGKNNHEEKKK